MLEFKDKVVLVTGSSHGIGRSIAISFAKEGANVIINYKNSDLDASVAYDIVSSYGNKCMCIKADVSKDRDVKNMIDTIIAEFGKIDVLVNNAGIAIDSEFGDKTISGWQDTMNTNVLGPFLTTKYAGKEMYKRQYGKIVNINLGKNDCFKTEYGVPSLTINIRRSHKYKAPSLPSLTCLPNQLVEDETVKIEL